MNKTLFAAMSGVAFGLVLGASGHHLYSQLGCHRGPAPTVVVVERPPVAVSSQDTPLPTLAEVDAQAEKNLAQARSLARTEPRQARQLCRQTMLLYNNNPQNARIRAAFKLLNSIRPGDEGDGDDEP